MTKMTNKQIAKAIAGGSKVVAREAKTWTNHDWKNTYTVDVDGERFEVTTASWNKMMRENDFHQVRVSECGATRVIISEIQ